MKLTHLQLVPRLMPSWQGEGKKFTFYFTFNSCRTQTQWRFHTSNSSEGSNAM
jgi:hypothetical protein